MTYNIHILWISVVLCYLDHADTMTLGYLGAIFFINYSLDYVDNEKMRKSFLKLLGYM